MKVPPAGPAPRLRREFGLVQVTASGGGIIVAWLAFLVGWVMITGLVAPVCRRWSAPPSGSRQVVAPGGRDPNRRRRHSHRDVRPCDSRPVADDDGVAPSRREITMTSSRSDVLTVRALTVAFRGRTRAWTPTTSSLRPMATRRCSPGRWLASAARGSRLSARPLIVRRRSCVPRCIAWPSGPSRSTACPDPATDV